MTRLGRGLKGKCNNNARESKIKEFHLGFGVPRLFPDCKFSDFIMSKKYSKDFALLEKEKLKINFELH